MDRKTGDRFVDERRGILWEVISPAATKTVVLAEVENHFGEIKNGMKIKTVHVLNWDDELVRYDESRHTQTALLAARLRYLLDAGIEDKILEHEKIYHDD